MRERSSAARFSPWWLLLLVLLPPLTFAMHFGGHLVLGWDSEPPLRPLQFLMTSLSAWKPDAYLGQPNIFGITQAPLALLYVVLTRAFNIVVADKIVLTAVFVLPAFTMYFCARRLFPNEPFVAFAAAWCYALSPLLFVRFYVPIVTVQLAYALLPLLVNVGIDLARRGTSPVRLLWLAAAQIALLPGASNLAYWLVPQITAAGLAVFLHLTDPQRRQKPRAKTFWQAIAVIVLLNGFWLVPQILFGLVAGSTFEHESINSAYTAGVRIDVTEGASLSYLLRMSSTAETGIGDANGPYWTYARALENGLIAAPFFLWMLLACAAMILRSRDRRVVILAVALCFGLFVMKGESPPLGIALTLFYHIPLAGTIFRNGYDKLLPMVAFSFALLLPVAAVAIGRTVRRLRAAQWALLVVVAAMAFPYWTGQMFMARPKGPTLSSIPPPDAFAFARILDGVKARVLFVPISDNPQLIATQWGFFGPNVYGSMTKAPVISMASSIMNTPGSDRVMTALHRAIADRDTAGFRALARDAAVGYVFVAHDIDSVYYGGETAEEIDEFLGSLGETRVVASLGPYTLWQLRWVAPVDTALMRRPITGYDTTFDRALAVASRCGGAPSVLIPQYHRGSCMVRLSPASQPESSPGPVFPVRAAIEGAVLHLSRAVGERTATSSSVQLPRGSAFAQLGSGIVGSGPATLSLVPCARYRVDAFSIGNPAPVVPARFAFPKFEIAHVILPRLATGLHAVTIDTALNGIGASAVILDAVTGWSATSSVSLAYPTTTMTLYAMPGRTYEVAFGQTEGFAAERSFARSITVSDAAGTGSTTIVAPQALPSCSFGGAGRAFAVRDSVILAAAAVRDGTLLVHPYDATTPDLALRVPLQAGSALAEIGNDVVGADAHDEAIATGAPAIVQTFRTTGPTRTLPIQAVMTSGGAIITNVDRASGTATLQTHDRAWLRYPIALHCSWECLMTVRMSAVVGRYGVAIVEDTGRVAAVGTDTTLTPELSFLFHPNPRIGYYLYVYSIANDVAVGNLQIGSASVTPIAWTGTVRFSIPRVYAVLPTHPDAVLVRGGHAIASAPFDGVTLRRSAVASALVLDTQYDPFWTTLIFPGRPPFIYFPQHAVADGYKNAWIVPARLSGRVVHFYLSNAIAAIGLFVCVLTLLALVARALAARAAKVHGTETHAVEAS